MVTTMAHDNLDNLFLQVMKFRKKFFIVEIAALMLDINPETHLVQHEHKNDKLKGIKEFLIVSNKDEYRSANKEEAQTITLHPKHRIYKELVKAIKDAIKCSDLYVYEDPREEMERLQLEEERFVTDFTEVQHEHVKLWAENNGFQCDFFGTIPTKQVRQHDFMDKNHPEHSIELGIAIEAWQRFSGLNLSHPKAYIKKWLEEQYGENTINDTAKITLSNKAINRIITLINWNSSGGTTTEGFKQSIYDQALYKTLP
jgi:hypothetical protein